MLPAGPRDWTISAPLVGIGVDICDTERFVGVRQRWGGRMDRVFSEGEQRAFAGARLGWCWAAREAIVKALRGRMLGSPLADMVVAGDERGGLSYRPRERARHQLASHGVSHVRLHTGTVAGAAVVIAVLLGSDARPSGAASWSLAWATLPYAAKDAASVTARQAAALAARQCVPTGVSPATMTWTGGHGSPPQVAVRGRDDVQLQVSLSHDGGLAGAVVAARSDPT